MGKGSPEVVSAADVRKDLLKMVKDSKKGPKFGLCLGKGADEDPIILTSRVKGAETLEKKARKDGGSPKSARGRLAFDGGKLMFCVEEDVPTGCLRQLKTYFKKYGVSTKVVLKMPDGSIDEGEDESAAKEQQNEVLKTFKDMVNKLAPKFATDLSLKDEVDEAADKLRSILAADTYDHFAAINILKQTARLGTKASTTAAVASDSPPDTGSDAEKNVDTLRATFKKMVPALQNVLKGAPDMQPRIVKLLSDFKDASSASPVDASAMQTATKAAMALLADLKAAEQKVVSNIEKSNSVWVTGLASARSQISKLKTVVLSECEGLPGAGRLDDSFSRLDARLKEFDSSISEKFEDGRTSRDVSKSVEAVEDFQNKLKTEVQWKDFDDNPFLKTTAIADLNSSLTEIKNNLLT